MLLIPWTKHLSNQRIFKENVNEKDNYTYNQKVIVKIYETHNEEKRFRELTITRHIEGNRDIGGKACNPSNKLK